MDETHSCMCCLRCPPDKDLTIADHDKTEIYSDMLHDCFNIQMLVDGWGSCWICLTCAGRLRDASDFKLQVQRCQAELRARTPAISHIKEEEPDMGLPADHEEETGYEQVLQELPGPGLADGAGASDDEESTVKLEMITIDEVELYAEPAVRSEVPAAAASDEERPQLDLLVSGTSDLQPVTMDVTLKISTQSKATRLRENLEPDKLVILTFDDAFMKAIETDDED